jgi:hypothetical protein
LSHARSAPKDKFHAPTVPLAAEFANRQVFLPDPVLCIRIKERNRIPLVL